MTFDVQTATIREPYPIEKKACPVLAISAEDDRFGTASRAKYIAASVPFGRAILFPTGGHALVGHYAGAAVTDILCTSGNRNAGCLATNVGSDELSFQSWQHFKEAFAPEIKLAAVCLCFTRRLAKAICIGKISASFFLADCVGNMLGLPIQSGHDGFLPRGYDSHSWDGVK